MKNRSKSIMISNLMLRKWHRDLGYFFIGLIISFAISGIAQNHRKTWDPQKYVYSSLPIHTNLNLKSQKVITTEQVQKMLDDQKQGLVLKDFRIEDKGTKLRAFFSQGVADINLLTGTGKLERLDTPPIIGQLANLHKSDQSLWIWYSDIFALGLIFIALSGMFLVRGKNSFRSKGYILMLAGMVIPLVFLFII